MAVALLLAPVAGSRAALLDQPDDGPGETPIPLGPALAEAGGAVVRGSIAPGDVDYFELPVVAGERIRAWVRTTDGGAFADPVLGVSLDGDDSIERTDDDDGPGFLPSLALQASANGTWRLALSGFGDAGFDGSHAEQFDYELIVAGPPDTAVEGDEAGNDTTPEEIGSSPFDALAPSGALAVGGTLLAALPGAGPGDVDRYAVPLDPGRDLTAAVFSDADPGFEDVTVRLSPPAAPETPQDDDDGPGFDSAALAETGPGVANGELWTVEVTRFRDEPGNDADSGYLLVVTASAELCDVDGDRDVDSDDLALIFDARESSATGPGDARDLDQDGTISVADHRACVLRCDNANCSPPSSGCGLLGIEVLLPAGLALARRRRRGRVPTVHAKEALR